MTTKTETLLPTGWTLVTLEDGRQRAERKLAYARLQAFDMRWSLTRPRIEWFAYDATGNTQLAHGEADSIEACMGAADEALTRLF